MRLEYASVAQLVERGTENPCVAGSIPAEGTKGTNSNLKKPFRHRTKNPPFRKIGFQFYSALIYTDVAQWIEQ